MKIAHHLKSSVPTGQGIQNLFGQTICTLWDTWIILRFVRLYSNGMQDAPDFFGGYWHINMAYTKMRKSIDHGIHNGRR